MIGLAHAAGLSDEDILDLLRVLGRGLSAAAETLRALPIKLVLRAGMSELELAEEYGRAVTELYPLLDPRRGPRADPAPAARGAEPGDQRDGAPRRSAAGITRDRRLLRGPRRLHPDRRGSPALRSWDVSRCAWKRWRATWSGRPGPAGEDDRGRRDAGLPRAAGAAGLRAGAGRGCRGRGRGLPAAACRSRAGRGAAARR